MKDESGLPLHPDSYFSRASAGIMGISRQTYVQAIYTNSDTDFFRAYRQDSGYSGFSLHCSDLALYQKLLRTDPITKNYVCYILTTYLTPGDQKRYPMTLSLYDSKPFQRANPTVTINHMESVRKSLP
jgi:hypothetical protein